MDFAIFTVEETGAASVGDGLHQEEEICGFGEESAGECLIFAIESELLPDVAPKVAHDPARIAIDRLTHAQPIAMVERVLRAELVVAWDKSVIVNRDVAPGGRSQEQTSDFGAVASESACGCERIALQASHYIESELDSYRAGRWLPDMNPYLAQAYHAVAGCMRRLKGGEWLRHGAA
jgi:hypothetical protein